MLTISLVTMIFYFHPSTTSAAIFYRTVPIMPVGTAGRVAEFNVGFSAAVKKDDVLFRLDSSKQDAVLETAKRKIAEVDATLVSARAVVVKADAQVAEAKSCSQQHR